ncbi:MAG: hypothetical protein WB507_02685 [Solirubrobacterales bacterium]
MYDLTAGSIAAEPRSAPLEQHRRAHRHEHLRWHGATSTHGFCGEPLGSGPFIALTPPAERLVCPECLTILRLYQRSGLWEGWGHAP